MEHESASDIKAQAAAYVSEAQTGRSMCSSPNLILKICLVWDEVRVLNVSEEIVHHVVRCSSLVYLVV